MLSAFAVGASGMLLQPPLRPTAAVTCPMAYRCPALVASEGRKNMLGGLFGKVFGKDASSSAEEELGAVRAAMEEAANAVRMAPAAAEQPAAAEEEAQAAQAMAAQAEAKAEAEAKAASMDAANLSKDDIALAETAAVVDEELDGNVEYYFDPNAGAAEVQEEVEEEEEEEVEEEVEEEDIEAELSAEEIRRLEEEVEQEIAEEEASRNPFSLVGVSRQSGPPPPPPGLYTDPEMTTGPLTAEEKAAEERKIAYIQQQEALASQDKKKDKGPTAQIDNSVFLVGTGVAVALSLLVVVATIATDGGL